MELVFEIGTEELPASFQPSSGEFLKKQLGDQLWGAWLVESPPSGLVVNAPTEGKGVPQIKWYATPRRLSVIATGILENSRSVPNSQSGPPVKIAFGPDGKLTKAGESFARKLGLRLELYGDRAAWERTWPITGERLVATTHTQSRPARELLPNILNQLITQIPFKKSMRWGDGLETFARPVHWIAAALDGEPIDLQFGDVKSGSTSRGHRFHSPDEFALPVAGSYVETLRARHVLADWEERKAKVWAEVTRAASEAAPGAEPRLDADLLETVTGLVEEPHAVLGRFDAHFLELPPEVLVSEMRGHQKYFAVQDGRTKALLPSFVAVSNTQVDHPAMSVRGYERVLRARLSDGRFFFDEDRKVTLESRVERLARITFFQGLGSQKDRSDRIRELALWLHGKTNRGDASALGDAGRLCKADLTCGMVSEFPELQGIMGKVYGTHEGLPAKVCDALFEHWLPRGAEDKLPEGDEGALLGAADRIDQLVGFFGLGHEPSGTADPYGLRRAAIGLLRLVLGKDLRLDLRAALAESQRLYLEQKKNGAAIRVSEKAELPDTIWNFLSGRLESLWKDRAPDAIAAVLHTGVRDVVSLEQRLSALCQVRASQPEQFAATAGAFKRIGNILEQARSKNVAPMSFHARLANLPAEQKLHEALEQAKGRVSTALESRDGAGWTAAYGVLAELRPAVDGFFDEVMVMDPDEAQRDNRLALLRALHELLSPLADFARLQA